MKRFMEDLGDLAGLDIATEPPRAPGGGVEGHADPMPSGAALARGALRWLGLVPAGDRRCPDDGRSGPASPGTPAPPLH